MTTDCATKWGLDTRHCMAENRKADGIAERFMGILVKVVHAAIASGQDQRLEVR